HAALLAHDGKLPANSVWIRTLELHCLERLEDPYALGALTANRSDPILTVVDVEKHSSRNLLDPATRTPVRDVQPDAVKVRAEANRPDGHVDAVVIFGRQHIYRFGLSRQ